MLSRMSCTVYGGDLLMSSRPRMSPGSRPAFAQWRWKNGISQPRATVGEEALFLQRAERIARHAVNRGSRSAAAGSRATAARSRGRGSTREEFGGIGCVGHARLARRPPSTWKVAPVMYAPQGETRNATRPAISSGWPTRPSGLQLQRELRASTRPAPAPNTFARRPVAMRPGQMVLTVMPAGGDLQRQRLRVADHRRPGRHRQAEARHRLQRGQRGDVDDPPARRSMKCGIAPRQRRTTLIRFCCTALSHAASSKDRQRRAAARRRC